MIPERVRLMSVEEYIDFVDSSDEWFEYIDGELFLMAPTKYNHNVISYNIVFRLGILLEDRDCQVLGTGQGIKAGETRFLIPDVCVVCGEPETEGDTRLLLNPFLIVEVTSPSSIDYDRGSKREFYSEVAALKAYLVVDQHRVLAELYTRSETGWHLQRFDGLEDSVPLEALECRLPLRDIYQSIRFESETSSSATAAL